ncbi:unnamed protein product [Symbiodinium necroappetens]|uniref:Prefoldin subunit 1 n=1 Tax=Symbiodinium necroappetens TaxID=1628268 RepID=A0A812MR28_9DINO|nr:unnamed protein product [Symbiodinium necroappetens]
MLSSLQARAPDNIQPLVGSRTCSLLGRCSFAMGKNKGSSKQKKDKAHKRSKDNEALDAEIAGQVKEVEERLQALTVEMKQVEGKIKHCLLEGKRAELTEKELQPMPEEMKVYRQVGKMFILQPKSDLARSLKAQAALKTVESQTLKQALNKIQEKVKSEANGLKELIGPERMKQLFQSGGSAGAAAEGPVPSEDAMMPLFGKAESKPDSKAETSDNKTKNGTGAEDKVSETEKAPATVEV